MEPIPVDISDADIGKRIAARRVDLGLTQLELAQSLGLIQSLISAYERGVLRLTAEMVIRFSRGLGVSADYLLGLNALEKPQQVFPKKITSRMEKIMMLSKNTQRHIFRMIDLYISTEKKDEIDNGEEESPVSARIPAQRERSSNTTTKEGKEWSNEALEMLYMYYPHLPQKELIELFPKKSWYECIQKAEELGIKRLVNDDNINLPRATSSKKGGPRGQIWKWTESDRQIIRSMYPVALKRDIVFRLKHRTWHAIQKEASRLGIKREVSDNEI